MAQIPDYEREIRGPNGEIYVESFTSIVDDAGGYQQNTYKLESTMPGTMAHFLGDYKWKHITSTNAIEDVEDRMGRFPWWSKPSNPEAITKKYAAGGRKILPTTRNVVTFVTYMANGRMQLQQRSYVSPQGKPIANPGFLSINGGLMESDDIEAELRREALEELGIGIGNNFAKVGDIYDPEASRINHVFRLTSGYDTLLVENISVGVVEAVGCLTNPEGLGRAYVWRGDLEAIIAAKMLTGISMRILAAFPDLLPPPRPKA